MPVDSSTIEAQAGAAGGLWTHTPVDWAGNEGPTAKPTNWPDNAITGRLSTTTGTRPGNSGAPGAVTGAPVFSAISVTAITTTGATINYTLSTTAVNQIDYGLTPTYGQQNATGSGTGPQVKPLTGLTSGRIYYYRITATANNATSYSPQGTFTTS
jgi:hypothetical protein